MKTEFTTACTALYRLQERFGKRDELFYNMLAKALPYTGQTSLAELDAIIDCTRKIQKLRAAIGETVAQLREVRDVILKIMEYFEIPPYTILTGEIPEELLFEIYADEEGNLYCYKTADLQPPVDAANIIRIKMCMDPYGGEEEEEW